MGTGVVTVVLPIYNVEKYLNRCLKSIVNQTYENLEIILVDDGSPDGCPELCEQWAKEDKRIKVVHKENAGLGYARNTGIENATGEYICFFDSDDYIAIDTIEKAYKFAKKVRADVVTFGFCNVKQSGETGKLHIPKPDKFLYSGKEVQTKFLPNLIGPDTATGETANLWMSAWGAFFSMDLIRKSNWRFVSERDIISEDVYSLLKLYKYVNRVAVLPEALYFYCENSTSLTHTYKEDRYERIKHFYDECLRACDELEYCETVKKRLAYLYFSNTIAALKMIVKSDNSTSLKKLLIKRIISDSHFREVLNKHEIRRESTGRKVLILAMKMQKVEICYTLIQLKA